MRIYLENLELSWNFIKFNKNPGKNIYEIWKKDQFVFQKRSVFVKQTILIQSKLAVILKKYLEMCWKNHGKMGTPDFNKRKK